VLHWMCDMSCTVTGLLLTCALPRWHKGWGGPAPRVVRGEEGGGFHQAARPADSLPRRPDDLTRGWTATSGALGQVAGSGG
jgi:hypothetical protein